MNIALSAVIIFILLLPPLAFYLAFISSGRFPKASPKLGLFEGLMLSAIVAVFLHALILIFINSEIRFDILALLVGGDLKSFSASISNHTFQSLFRSFVFYCFSTTVAALGLGFIFRQIVIRRGLHARSETLRLFNNWWYLFQGYKVDGFINSPTPVDFDILFVDVLVNTNAGTMLYSGYLIDFVCTGETLDCLYLSETIKREFKKNVVTEHGNTLVNVAGDPQEIDGDTMVIPYASVINMNLHFVTLPDDINDISLDATITIEPTPTSNSQTT
jgi:hypothetical protein